MVSRAAGGGFARLRPMFEAPPIAQSVLPPIPPTLAWGLLGLAGLAFAIALPATVALVRISRRLSAFDTAPIEGQQKMARRAIPNTGGIAIVLGFSLPIVVGLAGAFAFPEAIARAVPALAKHLPGIREQAASGAALLAGVVVIHVLGLIDDRRPLGAMPKLAVILGVSLAVVLATDTRLLVLLDDHAGGAWASVVITVLWFGVVTNAFNFMDNMDGLASGTAIVCCACFAAAAMLGGQLFVAAVLVLLLGATLGFFLLNYPPARIFMGDGGSLVLGFVLAFCTTRTTFYDTGSGQWYAVLMPLVVLAVPLYDFTSVTLIRIAQGTSPFKGDLQHLSHRLRKRGLTTRQTAAVVHGLAGITGLSGIVLVLAGPREAVLIGTQTALTLIVLAILERGSSGRRTDEIAP